MAASGFKRWAATAAGVLAVSASTYGVYAAGLSIAGQAGSQLAAGTGVPQLISDCQTDQLAITPVSVAPVTGAAGYDEIPAGYEISGVSQACVGRMIRLAVKIDGTFSQLPEAVTVVTGKSAYRIGLTGWAEDATKAPTGYSLHIDYGPYVSAEITGAMQVDSELSLTVQSRFGTGTAYQWQRSADGGDTWTDLPGEIDPGYTTVDADQGNLLRASATTTDQGQPWIVWSEPAAIDHAAGNGSFANPVALGLPTNSYSFAIRGDNETAAVASTPWGDENVSWFSWTPTHSGTLQLRTEALTNWNTTLQVYNEQGNRIAFDDNYYDVNDWYYYYGPCSQGTTCAHNAQVSFSYSSGQTYRIGLGGATGQTGAARLWFWGLT